MTASGLIPISRPSLTEAEEVAVREPLRDGWLVQGPRVAEFERAVAAFCGAEHAVATSSCTTSLHLGVVALGARPGDEVIVPALTWIATPNAVQYAGATPVFCDVELESFNLDIGAIENLLTERTVGILPVHLFGRAADMQGVNDLASRHGLWVLEDAACALGTRVQGRHAGTLGDAGCFSFHARKAITTGEGGMLVTSDPQLATLVRSLRDNGASRSNHDRHVGAGAFRLAEFENFGFNYRMTDLQGALGCAQMSRVDWILNERARQAMLYERALGDLGWLRTPQVREGEVHGWQSYVCLYAPEEATLSNLSALHQRRDRLMAALEREGIATRPGTHAPVTTAVYRNRYDLRSGQFPHAEIAERLSIALPLFAGLRDDELERVADAVRRLGP